MVSDRDTLTIAEGLSASGARTDLTRFRKGPLFKAQRPYPNGVTVYAMSVWAGNGFGDEIARVAVRDSQVVGFYESENAHQVARVIGIGDIVSDGELSGYGANRRRIVTRTALSKWIAAVKAL